MTDEREPEIPDLDDRELVELISNHDFKRRSVLSALGIGGVLSLGSGVATARHDDPHPPDIDSHYGYAAPEDEQLPGGIQPDHTVELKIGSFQEPFPFHFDPMGIHIDVGDIVRFNFQSPDHTVTAYHPGHGRQQRVPDDAPLFSSPVINAGGFWLYQFDHPGTYDIHCAPHQIFGMVMRLVVGDPESPEYDGDFGEEGRPPIRKENLEELPGIDNWTFLTSADAFESDALSVDNIVANGPVTRSEVADVC